jgi:hypothetical protein
MHYSRTEMGIALTLALALFAGAHVALVWGLARRPRAQWARAAVALFVPPLAPWWGWEAGLRRTTIVWGAALALYTLGVILTAR